MQIMDHSAVSDLYLIAVAQFSVLVHDGDVDDVFAWSIAKHKHFASESVDFGVCDTGMFELSIEIIKPFLLNFDILLGLLYLDLERQVNFIKRESSLLMHSNCGICSAPLQLWWR